MCLHSEKNMNHNKICKMSDNGCRIAVIPIVLKNNKRLV